VDGTSSLLVGFFIFPAHVGHESDNTATISLPISS
jgi:hypothetical protein